MKSSNSLIRTGEKSVECQPWAPVEFEQTQLLTTDLIRANAINFFGITKGVQKEKKVNLFKADQVNTPFQPWMPGDMHSAKETQKPDEPIIASWKPFIEQPNPRRMADQMLEEAKIKAEDIIEEANAAADQIRQEAYNQGVENAKSEMRETLQAATSVINVARDWREDLMRQAEPMIMDLVKKMAQKMFGEGVALNDLELQQHFSNVLESARSLGDLRIYMHPADAKALGPDWREYQSSALGSKVEIATNDSIRRGGCYIQGEWGTADALVETQLTTILDQFSEVETPERGEE